MIRTATAACNAVATSSAEQQPAGEGESRDQNDYGDEDRRDTVGEVLDRCLRVLRFLDRPDDPGSAVSRPTRVARTSKRPFWLMVAP